MRPPSVTRLRPLLYGLLLAELLLATWYRNLFGFYASPVVLYALALATCVVLYHYIRYAAWLPGRPLAPNTSPWPQAVAVLVAVGTGVAIGTHWVRRIMREVPVDVRASDIIPALQVYTHRWLAGQEIYTPLTQELGYHALPTYLPATWFPFVLPEWLGFDYRLWAWGALLVLGAGSYLLILQPQQRRWPVALALALVPFIIIFSLLRTEEGLTGRSVEGLIIGYYAVLVAGVLRRSAPLEALGLVLCLLSRYALVFWVPLYLGLMFCQESRRRALLLAGAVLAAVLGLYIVPYLSHDWALFWQVQRDYTTVALNEWQHLRADGLPYHVYNGLGFAPFFYRYGTGSLLERIQLLKTLHLGLLLLLTVGAAWIFWRQRAPRTNFRLYAVLVLKLYLATFYAFLQVPYGYLFTVSIFLSGFLVLMVALATPASSLPPADSPSVAPLAQT